MEPGTLLIDDPGFIGDLRRKLGQLARVNNDSDDDAEDAVQDALLRLLESDSLKRLATMGSGSRWAYLRKVQRATSTDTWRKYPLTSAGSGECPLLTGGMDDDEYGEPPVVEFVAVGDPRVITLRRKLRKGATEDYATAFLHQYPVFRSLVFAAVDRPEGVLTPWERRRGQCGTLLWAAWSSRRRSARS